MKRWKITFNGLLQWVFPWITEYFPDLKYTLVWIQSCSTKHHLGENFPMIIPQIYTFLKVTRHLNRYIYIYSISQGTYECKYIIPGVLVYKNKQKLHVRTDEVVKQNTSHSLFWEEISSNIEQHCSCIQVLVDCGRNSNYVYVNCHFRKGLSNQWSAEKERLTHVKFSFM